VERRIAYHGKEEQEAHARKDEEVAPTGERMNEGMNSSVEEKGRRPDLDRGVPEVGRKRWDATVLG
jgi:hypothetical protein